MTGDDGLLTLKQEQQSEAADYEILPNRKDNSRGKLGQEPNWATLTAGLKRSVGRGPGWPGQALRLGRRRGPEWQHIPRKAKLGLGATGLPYPGCHAGR